MTHLLVPFSAMLFPLDLHPLASPFSKVFLGFNGFATGTETIVCPSVALASSSFRYCAATCPAIFLVTKFSRANKMMIFQVAQ